MTDTRYQSIDVDFDVFQLIMLEKRGFDESDNEALRRLLGLDDSSGEPTSLPNGKGEFWSGKGVELPEGTQLRMTYLGIEHSGAIVSGKWKVGDECYNTPSAAASGVARTRTGAKTMLNGWEYWHVKRPSDETWAPLDNLRNGNRRK